MSEQARLALFRVEDRISELPEEAQTRANGLAEVIEEFVRTYGSIGHVALNLATARMAVKVLSP